MKILKVLVACEESQRVCVAFRELGHEAYSCDVAIRDMRNPLNSWDKSDSDFEKDMLGDADLELAIQ